MMEINNQSFSSLRDLQQKLNISNINPSNTLVQVFSGLNSEFEVKQIQSIFNEKNPEVNFIGSTTAGEINFEQIYTDTIVVSIVEFEDTIVQYISLTNDNDFTMGQELAKSLFQETTKALILFIDGLQTNGSDVADGINSVNSTIPIAGGLAGDNGSLINTFIFDKKNIYSKGCVGVSLNSTKLNVFTDYQLNWQPIGQEMTVTKVEKNRLYEINGVCVSDIYRKYLGKNVGNNLPFSATEFPLLIINDDGLEICRSFINKFDDGSLLAAGNFKVGDKVRLAFGNVDLILNSTKRKVLKYQQLQPEVLFTYSCTVRKAFLQSEVVAELKPLSAIAPTCGFFTYGELYHEKDQNTLLNISLTVLGLSENNVVNRDLPLEIIEDLDIFEKNYITNKHFLALEALTILSNSVIDELKQTNNELKMAKKDLEILATTDKLTGFFNRSKLDEILIIEIDRHKRYGHNFGCAIIDIDYFKHTNDTFGHLIGDKVLQDITKLIYKHIRKSDYFGRWGGEEFLLILPEIDIVGLKELLEKIRVMVNEYNIPDVGIKTISIGATLYKKNDTDVTIIKRVDDALYKAKNSGRNRVNII